MRSISSDGPFRDIQIPDQVCFFDDMSLQVFITCLFLIKTEFGIDTTDFSPLMKKLCAMKKSTIECHRRALRIEENPV